MILDLSSICHEGFKIKFTDPEIGILLRNSIGNAGATPGAGSLGNHGSDLAAVDGDELEQVVHSIDELDVAETLLDLGPGHANLHGESDALEAVGLGSL